MKHGGDLTTVMVLSGLGQNDILDLSTGIAPFAYPYDLEGLNLQALPQQQAMQNLKELARGYYHISTGQRLVAAAGTQILINIIPHLLDKSCVYIDWPSYGDHIRAWQQAGHNITHDIRDDFDHGVIVNPNNPTGHVSSNERLALIQDKLPENGLLLIDEAFMDATPSLSASAYVDDKTLRAEKIIILKSFGKFFGLAGVRLGFAFGISPLLDRLDEIMGDWPLSNLALMIAPQAYGDEIWIENQRRFLKENSDIMANMLEEKGFHIIGKTDLFITVLHEHARFIHEDLAKQGIWCRHFPDIENGHWLRFGLTNNDNDFMRLKMAL